MAITSGFQPDDVGSTPSSRSSSYNEFIGIYDGYFTDEFIDNTLNWYNTAKKQELIHTRRGHLVSDDAVGLLAQDYLDQIDGCVPMTYRLGPFTEMYWRAQEEYANQYPMLHEFDAQGIIDYTRYTIQILQYQSYNDNHTIPIEFGTKVRHDVAKSAVRSAQDAHFRE